MMPRIQYEIPVNAPDGYKDWRIYLECTIDSIEHELRESEVIKPFGVSYSCTQEMKDKLPQSFLSLLQQ